MTKWDQNYATEDQNIEIKKIWETNLNRDHNEEWDKLIKIKDQLRSKY